MRTAVDNVRIAGISAAVPRTVEKLVDSGYRTPEECVRLIKSTGVEQRRVAALDQTTSDLCCVAAETLLEEVQWSRDEVDLIVFITQTPDWILPATAITIQDRMGFPKRCAAFDVNLGCSGYTYGLHMVGGLIAGGGVNRALLLVGDTCTRGALPSKKKGTAPLFGDAGTATALERVEGAPTMYVDLQSDGSGYAAISHRLGACRTRYGKDSLEYEVLENGVVEIDTQFILDGPTILNFSAREVPPAVRATAEFAGTSLDDIDYFVFHQANRLINELVRKKLGLDEARVPSTLHDFANTSSATIPLTIVARLREEVRTRDLHWLLCGFGVGLSWGTVICRTDKIACPPVLDV